jgi:hypothetical protein
MEQHPGNLRYQIFVGTGWAQNGHKVLRDSAKYRKRKKQEGQ